MCLSSNATSRGRRGISSSLSRLGPTSGPGKAGENDPRSQSSTDGLAPSGPFVPHPPGGCAMQPPGCSFFGRFGRGRSLSTLWSNCRCPMGHCVISSSRITRLLPDPATAGQMGRPSAPPLGETVSSSGMQAPRRRGQARWRGASIRPRPSECAVATSCRLPPWHPLDWPGRASGASPT